MTTYQQFDQIMGTIKAIIVEVLFCNMVGNMIILYRPCRTLVYRAIALLFLCTYYNWGYETSSGCGAGFTQLKEQIASILLEDFLPSVLSFLPPSQISLPLLLLLLCGRPHFCRFGSLTPLLPSLD